MGGRYSSRSRREGLVLVEGGLRGGLGFFGGNGYFGSSGRGPLGSAFFARGIF